MKLGRWELSATYIFASGRPFTDLERLQQLLDQGRQVFVVEDAVCSRNAHHKANGLQRLRDAGAIITNSESVLFEWLRDARHEHFRELTAGLKD